MDPLQHRLDALEHQIHTLTQHTRTATRRLRWWRGLACALVGVGVLTWVLPSGTAQGTLEQRVAALEAKLVKLTFEAATNTVVLTGANLQIVNGLSSTDCTDAAGAPIPNCPNGLGNLIVGYNEPRPDAPENIRTGSHNVVVGMEQNFSRYGGMVVGRGNEISGDFAAVSGGERNTASGEGSSVSGGIVNRAIGRRSSVSGGFRNQANGGFSAVTGGTGNAAAGLGAAVSGGDNNRAFGEDSSITGGEGNTANGRGASVSGGDLNQANGGLSAVSGGSGRTAAGDLDWVAGLLFQDR
jgi:trimeric autotransporter adhesin